MLQKHIACVIYAALLAAWVNAFAPALSYFFASAAGKEVVEVCTSFGLKKVQLDSPADSSSGGHDVRCQFCLASLDAVSFSHTATRQALLPREADSVGSPAHAFPVRQRHAPSHRPRAPPLATA
ncbi:MAG: hypothetical protein RJA63_2284 [Pseudomonadota bacterium]|jgi:hypothetical protein